MARFLILYFALTIAQLVILGTRWFELRFDSGTASLSGFEQAPQLGSLILVQALLGFLFIYIRFRRTLMSIALLGAVAVSWGAVLASSQDSRAIQTALSALTGISTDAGSTSGNSGAPADALHSGEAIIQTASPLIFTVLSGLTILAAMAGIWLAPRLAKSRGGSSGSKAEGVEMSESGASSRDLWDSQG